VFIETSEWKEEQAMAKKELLTLLQSASVKDLKELLVLKKELDALEKKEKALLKQFASVSKDIGSIQTAFGKPRRRKPAAPVKKTTGKGARKSGKEKAVQQPLSSLIAEILKEKKKPLGVNDICDALLKEKKYKTKAKNFKANVRILLYKNEKGLYKKAGPGKFRLAAAKKR
jgi:seryl-tRNA synthetase